TKEGRTVLFVSHNMAAVTTLCNRAIYLKNGVMYLQGATAEVASHYQIDAVDPLVRSGEFNTRDRKGLGNARFTSLQIWAVSRTGETLPYAFNGCDLVIETEIACVSEIMEANVAIIIYDSQSYRLIDVNTA